MKHFIKYIFAFSIIFFTACFQSDETLYPFASCSPVNKEYEELTNDETFFIVSQLTGVPAGIIAGFAYAESGFDDYAIGDGGISLGMFQINETYHWNRMKLIGREYDPHNTFDAALVTALNYKKNLKIFGNQRDAIACHKQGVRGVKKNGRIEWYVSKVIRYSRKYKPEFNRDVFQQ